ncbi:MAG: PAS domain S-box protein [Gemmatimonadota bacterium]
MIELAVLALSIGLQILAAILALRLIPVTGWRRPWILIAVALLLMALRRGVTLYQALSPGGEGRPDLAAETIALLISLLMVGGVYLIGPLFRSIKESEEALRWAEERFRDLVENTSDWIWEVDERPAFTYCSPRSKDLLGYEPSELTGRHPHDLMDPSEKSRAMRAFDELMARREPFVRVENVNLHKDGRRVVLETSGVPLFDEKGRFRGYRGVDRDVTERKEVEEALERVNRAHRVLSKGREGLIRAQDEEGLWTHACRVVVEEGGYAFAWMGLAAAPPEKTVRPVARWGEDGGYLDSVEIRWDDSPRSRGPTGTALKTGEPFVAHDIATDPIFAPWRDAALAVGFASSVALPLIHDEEVIGALNVYSRDARAFDAEEVRLLQELADDLAYGAAALRTRAREKELNAILRHRQRLEELGQVTGGIAHDFNNQLTIIRTNAHLLKDHEPRDGTLEFAECLAELEGAAEGCRTLVRRLLAFSRRDELRLEPLDLSGVAREVVDTLPRLLPEEIELRFSTEPPDLAAPVLADSGAVEQIILNLATNARDAMPGGGVVQVTVAERRLEERDTPLFGRLAAGPYLCLSVEDEGTGMSREIQERIFEPFFTTKEVGEGTGLGLAVVFGLVKQFGGFIEVESEEGSGTAVRVYLPRTDEAPSPAGSGEVGQELRGGQETVLVVDDEKGLRRTTCRCLERYGYRTLAAADGAAALEMIQAEGEAIALVVCDVRMPVMDGVELYERARRLGFARPFIFTSGYLDYVSDEEGSRERRRLPRVPFLEKPWTVEDLIRVVRETLDAPPESLIAGADP